MPETEYVIGEIYEIIEIGKDSAWYFQRDDLVGKQIVLEEIGALSRHKNGYRAFGGTLVESLDYIDENGEKKHMSKGEIIFCFKMKLKKT